jgi:hypothetical protein
MLINLWSTPRTSSTWYSLYLLQKLKEQNPKTILLTQFFGQHRLTSYYKPNFDNFVYQYENGCWYENYGLIANRKIQKLPPIHSKRIRNLIEEEKYRKSLIKKHNFSDYPIIMHNHVLPMNKEIYEFLHEKATKNIFIYRENFIDQLSSYAIAYQTNNFVEYKKKENNISNIHINYDILKNLTDRIIYWHKLDKTNCEIIKYEDIDFSNSNNLPIKQNNNSFDKLSKQTQNDTLKLQTYFEQNK